MKCFNNGEPNISGSEYTKNKANKTIYKHNVERTKGYTANYNGEIQYDSKKSIENVRSQETLLALHKGHYLCKDCNGKLLKRNVEMENSMESTVVLDVSSVKFKGISGVDFRRYRVDPSNKLVGIGCEKDLLLSKVNVPDISGNNGNYLRYFKYPDKIILE
tara:strand:+ start:77 stop:559 length:483 start_codon:yes stop_codon:yes gene_type:complete